MFNKLKTLLLFLAVSPVFARAQSDLQFSQYMFNYLYINPAYAGYKEQLNATAFYRAQLLGFKGAPTTYSLSLDAPLFSDNMGFGLQVNNDKIGIQGTTTANFVYAYRIAVNEDARLCFGLEGGISQFSQDPSRSHPTDLNDPTILKGVVNSNSITSKAGAFYYNSAFYLGLSASNLYSKSITNMSYLVQIPPLEKHYYFTAGAIFQVNDNIALKPSILFKDPQHGISTADINCFALLNQRLWVGLSYRMGVSASGGTIDRGSAGNQNAILALFEYYVNEKLRIGYAYDYPFNTLVGFKSGNHEISVGYYIPIIRKTYKNSMVTPRYF